MLRVLLDIGCGLWESIRETLPATEDEAGVWLAGFCWAFVIFCVLLVAVTWLWAKANGMPL